MLTAALLSAGMVGAAPVTPTGNFIPTEKDFRTQRIHRLQGETDWPFAADKGLMLCAPSWQNRLVYFVPIGADGKNEAPLALDYGLATIAMINMGRASAFRPYENFEQFVKRLAPYIAMGKRLCDQPAGTDLPDSAF